MWCSVLLEAKYRVPSDLLVATPVSRVRGRARIKMVRLALSDRMLRPIKGGADDEGYATTVDAASSLRLPRLFELLDFRTHGVTIVRVVGSQELVRRYLIG
jgi:hypothetical protein